MVSSWHWITICKVIKKSIIENWSQLISKSWETTSLIHLTVISTVDEAGHDLESLLTFYNTTLIGLFDKHAPLKTRTIMIRRSAPWSTEDIREEKQKKGHWNDVGEGLDLRSIASVSLTSVRW